MATLTERLAARATKSAMEKGRGRAAFLALKPDVHAALQEGWKAKEIWSLLRDEGKIGVSYSVFLRYIREYIVRTYEPVEAAQIEEGRQASLAQPAQASTPAVGADQGGLKKPPQADELPRNFNLSTQPDKGKLV